MSQLLKQMRINCLHYKSTKCIFIIDYDSNIGVKSKIIIINLIKLQNCNSIIKKEIKVIDTKKEKY